MSNQPQIVYLDSDVESCRFLEALLTDIYQLPTTAVTDPTLLLELSTSRPFDLYLMDYCYPETTAVEICRSIRALAIGSPIVVYSALDRDVDRRLASEAGADLFLSKPDDLPILGSEVRRLLRSRHNEAVRAPEFPSFGMTGHTGRPGRAKLRRKGAGIL